MLNLFGKNAFSRKRKAKVMPVDTASSRIESLEERVVPASFTNVAYDATNGNLTLTGSGDADTVTVTFTANNTVTVTTTGTFTPTGVNTVGLIVTGDLRIDMGNGADTVNIVGGGFQLDSGNTYIDLGSGADTLNVGAASAMTFTGNVSVEGGTESDTVNFGAGGAVTVANLSIDLGTQATAAQAESVLLDQLTANGNVSIVNGGTGLQRARIGSVVAAANQINGNLTIVQANNANTGGYTATLTDTSVTGNVLIQNGVGTTAAGTGAAVISITTTAARTIGGTTTLTNGNNDTNAITMAGAASNQAVFAGTVTATNGVAANAAASNTITVNGATVGTNTTNNRTSAAFTNGAGAIDAINIGTAALGNTFNAAVYARNVSNGATSNTITLNNDTFNRNIALSNGLFTFGAAVSTTANSVVVASTADVNVTGNVNIDNANTGGAGTNTVTIGAAGGFGLSTAAPAGVTGAANVNITNGNTAATAATVTIQGDASADNTLAGNLSVRNAGATAAGGTKVIALSGLTTNGRTGITLNNAGAGNSTTTLGTTAANSVLVNGVGGLYVEDGSGTGTLNLNFATIGTLANVGRSLGFRYSDFGGGSDTINIANNAAGNVVIINGVTRLDTAGGGDTVDVGFGAAGTTTFNDSVFVDLGDGNDTLRIGNNASSPGLSSADKFRFNGGNGQDLINADQTSVSSFAVTAPNKIVPRLRSKVVSFETITVTP